MDLEEARQIVEDYFLAHATTMTTRQCTAFLIMLICFPLIPEYVHNMGRIHTLDDLEY